MELVELTTEMEKQGTQTHEHKCTICTIRFVFISTAPLITELQVHSPVKMLDSKTGMPKVI